MILYNLKVFKGFYEGFKDFGGLLERGVEGKSAGGDGFGDRFYTYKPFFNLSDGDWVILSEGGDQRRNLGEVIKKGKIVIFHGVC